MAQTRLDPISGVYVFSLSDVSGYARTDTLCRDVDAAIP